MTSKKKQKPKLGRPHVYDRASVITLKPADNAPRLQRDSLRRELIDFLLERDCRATLGEMGDQFGRNRVLALVRAGWLTLAEPEAA